jgi:hypothetical protein
MKRINHQKMLIRDYGKKRGFSPLILVYILSWVTLNRSNKATPMPVIRSSSGSSSFPIPLEALQEPRRILKRPTNASNPGVAAPLTKSVSEREASYQAARDRIFGTPEQQTKPSNESQRTSSGIVRTPIGAPSNPASHAGFTKRSTKSRSQSGTTNFTPDQTRHRQPADSEAVTESESSHA